MVHYLMRKNEAVALIDISPAGIVTKIGKIISPELVPLQNKANRNGIISWWQDRSIPIKQGKVQEMLRANGIATANLYLTQNLGLSLTDYYWIKPMNMDLTWEQVNLFDNDFKDNLLLGTIKIRDEEDTLHYTPNSSLQGNLEKTWVIDQGIRKLVKGNHSDLSSESINEVIISQAIKEQGVNCASYDLIEIKGKPYDYGSISPIFTSQNLELVSAYAVMTSEIKPNHISSYEHFIGMCVKNGMNESDVRHYLEFEIEMDFVFSNRDRHLTNISVLRDANSLQFVSMAPIYDSGKSMFVGKDVVPVTNKMLLDIGVTSFKNNELDLMELVQDRDAVDIGKLPTVDYIRDMYLHDSKISDERLRFVLETYERKKDLLYQFQLGKNLKSLKFSSNYPVYGYESDVERE